MKRFSIILLMGILLCSVVSAQDIDAVILTTTVNYPDSFVAAVAANKIGAPLLLTDRDEIPGDTMDQLGELKPSMVYLIGGPSVISTEVEDSLKNQGYEVIRLWGITRYGTSTEVAEYFWVEGSGKAILVWDKTGTPEDGNENILVMAKDLAQANDAPLLISAKNTLSSMVEETLGNLNVEEVVLVGDFTDDVKIAIQDLGIDIGDEIIGDETGIGDRVRDKIRNQTRDMDQNETPFVVIAVGDWKDAIKAPFHPGKGVSRLVGDEGEIQDVIEEIGEGDYTRIVVVGKPDLAQQICDAFTAEGIEHNCLTGNASKVAAQIAERERERIRNLRERFEGTLSRIRDRLRERAQEIEGECGEFLDLANATFSDVEEDLADAQQYRERIQELKQARQECADSVAEGNLTRARERLQQLKSDVKVFRWAIRDHIGDEIEDETDAETKGRSEVAEAVRDRIQEIKRIGDEIRAIDEEIAERCTEMVQQMEELENEGEYSKIQNRIKVALQGCTEAQEEAEGKKGKATTSTLRGKGTTTTTAVEGATTTTTRGPGRR